MDDDEHHDVSPIGLIFGMMLAVFLSVLVLAYCARAYGQEKQPNSPGEEVQGVGAIVIALAVHTRELTAYFLPVMRHGTRYYITVVAAEDIVVESVAVYVRGQGFKNIPAGEFFPLTMSKGQSLVIMSESLESAPRGDPI